MYFRCDGEYTLLNNTIQCDAWTAVPEQELLSTFVQQYGINGEQYAALASFTFVAFLFVAGIKSKIHVLLHSHK